MAAAGLPVDVHVSCRFVVQSDVWLYYLPHKCVWSYFYFLASLAMAASVNSDMFQCGIWITLFSPTVALSLAILWAQHFFKPVKTKKNDDIDFVYCVDV